MIHIGIIGLGVIAQYYLAAFPQSMTAKLRAVCDLDDSKTEPYLDTDVCTYSDYLELLKDPSIDAVVINLPNDLHFKACQDALAYGKHVCCEKPLTLSVDEAKKLKQVAQRTELTLFTAFHRRYNQPLIELKQQVSSLDEVSHVDIYYLEKIEEHAGNDTWYLDPEKCGGGCIADNGPNAFDTLEWLIGPLAVKKVEITRDDKGMDIEAVVNLENHQGLTATTYLDWAYQKGEDKRVVFTMKDGRVLSSDMLRGSVAFKSSLFHEYARVIDDFVLHITERRGAGEEGLSAVKLVKHCYALEGEEQHDLERNVSSL